MKAHEQFNNFLNFALKWSAEQELLILADGLPLNEFQLSYAKMIGIKNFKKVRLLKINEIPRPSLSVINFFSDFSDFVTTNTIGIT